MMSKDERLKYAYTFIQFNEKDLKLDFWQDQYLRSYSRFIAIVKSRRVGWSFVSALKGIVKAMDQERIAYTKQFVSYNEADALEKINYAAQFYESIPKAAKKKCVTNNKTELDFIDNNGKTISRLISIPCRPPRGKGGDISLDEYAIYLPKMSKAVYTAALPVISRGGCIEMGSSPLGKIGKFYDIITDKHTFPSYERYNIAWWFCRDLCKDVVNAIKLAPEMSTEERVHIFGTDVIKEIFSSSNIDEFQQEYECAFIDEEASYISLDLIYANTPGMNDDAVIEMAQDESVSDDEYYNYNRGVDFQAYKTADEAILNYNPDLHGKPLYFGFDVGRTHDATSIYLIGNKNEKKRSFARIRMKNAPYDLQRDTVLKLYNNLPIHRGCMDATGMGKPIFEELQKKLGDRIEGLTFTPEIKEILAMSVKHGLEQREFELENSKEFHTQIHSIKRLPAIGKYFRYDAERNELGHADDFWSWALANYASGGSGGKTGNFYSTWKRNENNKVPEVETKTDNEIIVPKGKSLNSVLRKMHLK
jgi:phage FluMu gp28-like protein